MRLLIFFVSFVFTISGYTAIFNNGRPFRACEIQLARYINGEQFAREFGVSRANFWYEEFDANWMLSTFKDKNDLKKSVTLIKRFLDRDPIFAKNLEKLVNKALLKRELTFDEVKAIFREKKINGTIVSFSSTGKPVKGLKVAPNQFIHLKVDQDSNALKAWLAFNKKGKLSKFYQNEYQRILFSLNFTKEEFELLAKTYTPEGTVQDLSLFEDYMGFIKFRDSKYRLKAIKDIKEIKKPLGVAGQKLNSPTEAFKNYRIKVNKNYERRVSFHEQRLKKENKGNLTDTFKNRAKLIAKRENGIFKRLLAGCKGSHKSPSLRRATKKFKQFKIATSLGFGIWGYTTSNADKLEADSSWYQHLRKELGLKSEIKEFGDETDAYWFRRLGYEIGSGLAFTWVNNLIITNPATSAFQKGWTGYLKFSAMDGVNAWGYDQLFASDSKKLKAEFESLRQDPNFQKKLKEILNEVESKSSGTTIKKFLDKHINLSASTAKEDLEKLTLEDLNSEAAQELILELLAERMYLNNMGEIPFFQTGTTGGDRWFFYRLFNLPNTIKSIAVDLLIFRIMCMKSGPNATSTDTAVAFLTALGIQLADKRIFTPLLYEPRRKAINQ